MKQYINANMQVVPMGNNDIVTTSIGVGNKTVTDPDIIQAPGRRPSIWD